MTPFWTLLSLGAIFGFVMSCFLFGIIFAVRAMFRHLKPWVLLDDEEGGKGFLGRARLVDGHIIHGKGDNIKRYPVRVESRSLTNQGILYKVGLQTGANLRTPRTAAIRRALDGDPGAQLMFDVADPGLLGRTYARRMAQETVDSQTEKEDWKKTAILPLTIVASLAIIGVIVAVVTMAPGA